MRQKNVMIICLYLHSEHVTSVNLKFIVYYT